MRKEYPINGANIISTPGGSTEQAAVPSSGYSLTDFNIPAGKYKVIIENRGMDNGGSPNEATVNGASLSVGQSWVFDAVNDVANSKFITAPAISVVTNGSSIWYQYYE